MTWTIKDSNDRKIVEGFLDLSTSRAISKLQARGIVDDLVGVAKEGKESTIIVATDKDGKKIILKIFKIEASQFQKMQKYIVGDRRFAGIKLTRRSLVYNWCKKEFSNLKRSKKAGVNVPTPIAFYKNILVMEYIGGTELSPKLKEVQLKSPVKTFDDIIKEIKKLYHEAGLVHADLSEYNVLFFDGRPVIHDLAQAVELSHQLAGEFLDRDISNLCRYFGGLGVVRDKDKIIQAILKSKS
ncbi:MAG: serine protein kinase RIO [archaeon]